MTDTAMPPGETLHGQLERWVAEGLLSADQATRIEQAEASRVRPAVRIPPAAPAAAERILGEPAASRPRAVPIVVEALGYLGGLLAAVAGVVAVRHLWPDIPDWAEVAFAAGTGVALLVAGFAVRAGIDPLLRRLRAVLWLLSTAGIAGAAGLLVVEVWSIGGVAAGLLTASIATAYAVPLWLLSHSPLQHAAVFAGLAVVAATGIGLLDEDLLPTSAGVAVWVLSGLWAFAAHAGRVHPRGTGYLVASIGLLVGALMTMETAAGVVLALGTVGALLVGGVASGRVWLLALGALGVVQVVPAAASRYLPESVGAPVALLAVGLILLSSAVWLMRRRSTRPPAGAGTGGTGTASGTGSSPPARRAG